MRRALGAPRSRIVRQLLTESALISVIGGIAGLLVAYWTGSIMLANLRDFPDPYLLSFNPDATVLMFGLLLSLVTGLLFGLAPALEASSTDLITTLKDASASIGWRRSRLRDGLIVAQVALSLFLLVAAALFVNALRRAATLDLGFRQTGVLIAGIDLKRQGYSEARGRLFQSRLMERLEALPGVLSASISESGPLQSTFWTLRIEIPGREALTEVGRNHVHPHFFETLDIRVLRGRGLTGADTEGAPRVALVNEVMARRYWPGEDPVGKRFNAAFLQSRIPYQVVGVVEDIGGNLWPAKPHVYMSILQHWIEEPEIYIRSALPLNEAAAGLRAEVAALDKDLPVYRVMSLERDFAESLWSQRMTASMVGAFGVLALVLASVGIYGVMSYAVSRRTREIGIRIALGSQARRVFMLVMRQGLQLVLIGFTLGIAASLPLPRLLREELYDVGRLDLPALAAGSAVLFAVGAAACYLPARRASRVDPAIALRHE
jgi:putative ABC transport system permease protein